MTETVLLRLAVQHNTGNLTIRAFKKIEEKQHGADWEWAFVSGPSAVCLRVQAKRLYKGSKYAKLRSGTGQIDRLIANAGNFHPFYVLYNNSYDIGRKFGSIYCLPRDECFNFYGRSYWGCSIASAFAVKNIGSNRVDKLLPVMKPWHYLACPTGKRNAPLPNVVAGNLSRAFGEYSEQGFAPRSPPDWSRALLAAESTEDSITEWLNGYLEERELQGVVVVHATWRDEAR